MTERLTSLWLGIVAGWVLFWLLSGWLAPAPAAGLGLGLGIAGVHVLRESRAVTGAVAVLEPVGVVLPLLVLWHMARASGLALPQLSTPVLALYLVAHVAFLAASMGVARAEPYRAGYAPGPVAIMVLAACGIGWVAGTQLIPVVAVAGQALWARGWGSSNWFDHVLHATLVPVAAIALLLRLL